MLRSAPLGALTWVCLTAARVAAAGPPTDDTHSATEEVAAPTVLLQRPAELRPEEPRPSEDETLNAVDPSDPEDSSPTSEATNVAESEGVAGRPVEHEPTATPARPPAAGEDDELAPIYIDAQERRAAESAQRRDAESRREPQYIADQRETSRNAFREWADARRDRRPPLKGGPAHRRRGLTLAPAIGFAGCSHLWCAGYRGGVGAAFEFGLRLGRFMPNLSLDYGAGRYSRSELSEELDAPVSGGAKVRFLGVGPGFTLFLTKGGPWDPYANVRLGYSRTRLAARTQSGVDLEEVLSRGGLQIGGGFDLEVSKLVAIGPRFGVTIPFSGTVCVTARTPDADDIDSCVPVKNLEDDARIDRRNLALPWNVLFQVRITSPLRI